MHCKCKGMLQERQSTNIDLATTVLEPTTSIPQPSPLCLNVSPSSNSKITTHPTNATLLLPKRLPSLTLAYRNHDLQSLVKFAKSLTTSLAMTTHWRF
jgi:hypothetical protein